MKNYPILDVNIAEIQKPNSKVTQERKYSIHLHIFLSHSYQKSASHVEFLERKCVVCSHINVEYKTRSGK